MQKTPLTTCIGKRTKRQEKSNYCIVAQCEDTRT